MMSVVLDDFHGCWPRMDTDEPQIFMCNSDGFHGIRHGFHIAAELFHQFERFAIRRDLIHHGAADDAAIRFLRDAFGLVGIRDAEADDDGQRGVGPDLRDLRGEIRCDAGLHSGHAFTGDVVDETCTAFDDGGHAVFRRGRRDEVDVAKARLFHQGFVVVTFFRGQIQYEQAVHARPGGLVDELFHADAMDEVEIDVEDDGDLRLLADVRNGFQQAGRGGAGFQAALGGELVHQAVRERIAKGHAQFQDIHARLIEFQRQLASGFQMRIARADIDDEGLFAGALELGEAGFNTIHVPGIVPAQLAGGKCKFRCPGWFSPLARGLWVGNDLRRDIT